MSEYKAKTDWLKKRLNVKYGRPTEKKTNTNALIQTEIVQSKPQYKGKNKLIKEISSDITAYKKFEANKSRRTESSSTRKIIK
jgi:hypothetical protein